MKTKQIPVLIVLIVLFSMAFTFFGFTKSNHPVKFVAVAHKTSHKDKRMDDYYFEFTDGSGNEFIVYGQGGVGSGYVTAYVNGCVDGSRVATGTASGTYTITSGSATISGTIKPTGYSSEPFPGPASYSTSEPTLTCN